MLTTRRTSQQHAWKEICCLYLFQTTIFLAVAFLGRAGRLCETKDAVSTSGIAEFLPEIIATAAGWEYLSGSAITSFWRAEP